MSSDSEDMTRMDHLEISIDHRAVLALLGPLLFGGGVALVSTIGLGLIAVAGSWVAIVLVGHIGAGGGSTDE